MPSPAINAHPAQTHAPVHRVRNSVYRVSEADVYSAGRSAQGGQEGWAEHHHGWQVIMAADRHPMFVPPPWVDPDQTPRRNTRPRYERAGPQLDE